MGNKSSTSNKSSILYCSKCIHYVKLCDYSYVYIPKNKKKIDCVECYQIILNFFNKVFIICDTIWSHEQRRAELKKLLDNSCCNCDRLYLIYDIVLIINKIAEAAITIFDAFYKNIVLHNCTNYTCATCSVYTIKSIRLLDYRIENLDCCRFKEKHYFHICHLCGNKPLLGRFKELLKKISKNNNESEVINLILTYNDITQNHDIVNSLKNNFNELTMSRIIPIVVDDINNMILRLKVDYVTKPVNNILSICEEIDIIDNDKYLC